MKCIFRLLMLFLGAFLLPSCYNRLTGNYDEFPDIHDSRNAVIAESKKSSAELSNDRKLLREWNSRKPPEYKINAGDKLSIVVYDHPDLNMTTVVTPDGYIGMVFVGSVYIKDKTLVQASKLLEEVLADYIKNPSVAVSPLEIHSETVTIVGAVSKPGIYSIHDGMKLADLYAKAGGSSVRRFDGQDLDAADLTKSVFVRESTVVREVNFPLAIEQGDPDHNLVLHHGDYIYIAVRSESMVCVIGDVGHSVKRIWDNNLGLLEVLTSAGFVRETYWPYCIIIRGSLSNPMLYKVDIDSILQGRKPNVLLMPNDVVYLPKDNISEFNVFIRKIMPSSAFFSTMRGYSHW